MIVIEEDKIRSLGVMGVAAPATLFPLLSYRYYLSKR